MVGPYMLLTVDNGNKTYKVVPLETTLGSPKCFPWPEDYKYLEDLGVDIEKGFVPGQELTTASGNWCKCCEKGSGGVELTNYFRNLSWLSFK